MVLFRAGMLAESDTFWQVRAGQLTLATHALPTVDTFSWTAFGEAWQPHSWAFNVLLALAYNSAGLVGVALVCAALTTLAAGTVLLLMRQMGVGPLLAAVAIVGSSPLVIAWFSARPQSIDYIAVPALLLLLRPLTESRNALRSIVLIAMLMAAWVNLHEASLLGLAIIAACVPILLLFRMPRRAVVLTLLALAVATLATLCNPWGLEVLTRATDVAQASTPLILEWQHPDLTDPVTLIGLLIGALGLWRAFRSRNAVFTAALSVTLLGAGMALRIWPILVLVALPMVVAGTPHPKFANYFRSRRAVLVPGLVLGELALLFVALPSLGHIGQPDPSVYSPSVVARIPSGCRLFNSYLTGGFVILERPDVQVSIDSRNDLYGVDRVRQAERAVAGSVPVSEALAGAGCALIPTESPLARALHRDAAWRLVAADNVSTLFTRL